MASGLIRRAVMRQLVTVARAAPALAGVQVSVRPPGDTLASEAIWVGFSAPGTVAIANMVGGHKQTDDDSTFDLFAIVRGRLDYESTWDRLESIMWAVGYTLADDPTLGNMDGLMWAVLGPKLDLEVYDLANGGGFEGFATSEVTVKTRVL